MTPLDPNVRQLVDELANALQSVVLIAEYLEREAASVSLGVSDVTKGLRRATTASRHDGIGVGQGS